MKRRHFVSGMAAGLLGASGFGAWSMSQRGNPYYDGPASDHFDGRLFFNPQGMPPGSLSDLLKWRLTNSPAKWPKFWASPHHGKPPEPRVEGDRLVVTLIGHASFLIQTGGLNILTDPVWSQRVSPVSFAGPRRVNPPGIEFSQLPKIDIVLVTHNHYDHLDLATIGRLVARDQPTIITPLGNDAIILGRVRDAALMAGDWGDSFANTDSPITIHLVPMHHWSARGMNDRRMALWCGFVIETPTGNILHIGDTGFNEGAGFAELAARYGPFRLANIPIGAYEPRWFMKSQHVNPDEAARVKQLTKAEFAIGHHWGTFQLTEEAIEAPRLALELACDTHNIDLNRFLAARPGQAIEVPMLERS